MDELVIDFSSVFDRMNDLFFVYFDIMIGMRELLLVIFVWKVLWKRWGRKCWLDYLLFCDCLKVSVESNDFVEEVLMDYIENIFMC